MESTFPYPHLVLIAAMDEHHLLADQHGIPWHLPHDVAHFRACTHQKWLLLGRRTYEEMVGWFQPGHRPLVLSHDPNWQPSLGMAFSDLSQAWQHVRQSDPEAREIYCCGGASIYQLSLPWASRMILTRIHHRHTPRGNAVYFPRWDNSQWRIVHTNHHPADAQNVYAMDMVTLQRMTPVMPSTDIVNPQTDRG